MILAGFAFIPRLSQRTELPHATFADARPQPLKTMLHPCKHVPEIWVFHSLLWMFPVDRNLENKRQQPLTKK
jgi:hypothetical protein